MLPGKVYKPEDILLLLRRRYWLVIVPFAVVAAATAVYARLLPDVYRSETLIMVVPQKVPESYVRSTISTSIESRLQNITQQILSRTRLERIILDNNLYADERKSGIMEDIVERMRTRDVNVQIVKGDAFRVSFQGENPRTVQKVTEKLASFYIEESLRDRELQADGTNQFLEAQLEDARRRLVEHEKKLEDYRRQYAGELPSQMESNLEAIRTAQSQAQSVMESLNRDRDRRLILERQVADLQSAAETAAQSGTADASGTAAHQLAQAQSALKALQLRLKDDHPDVQRLKRAIVDLEARAERERLEAPVGGPALPATPAAIERRKRIDDLKVELAMIDRQITQKQDQEKRLRGVTDNYQHRVEAVPARESEMAELTRDYDTLTKMYTSLLTKREDSKIAANLERRQIGEQFKIVDAARVPERPFSPNRQLINLMGMGGGLALGVMLIALLEYRDSSFGTDHEVTRVLALPVLAVVPLMQSDPERRRARRWSLLLNLTLGSVTTACLALLAYTFVR